MMSDMYYPGAKGRKRSRGQHWHLASVDSTLKDPACKTCKEPEEVEYDIEVSESEV